MEQPRNIIPLNLEQTQEGNWRRRMMLKSEDLKGNWNMSGCHLEVEGS
jgi:hypothetical protein